MTPLWPIRPRGSCCATSATSRPGSVNCARHCARPAAPARPSARPMSWPAWAVALVFAGRTAAGLAAFEAAVRRSCWCPGGPGPYRRAIVFYRPGPVPGGSGRRAARGRRAAAAGDPLWTARALNTRAALPEAGVDQPGRRRLRFRHPAVLHHRAGVGSARLRWLNRALDRFRVGRPPGRAGPYLDAATLSYQRLKVPASALRVERCAVLLAAGLVGDALAEAEAALREIEEIHGQAHG